MRVVNNVTSTQKDDPRAFTLYSFESPISLLGLSPRSYVALTDNGYDTIGKVIALNEKSLGAIKYLNKKSIKEILTTKERLQQQNITTEKDKNENINVPDCRFIYARETIYPTDYIGVLDISLNAHNVLYKNGIFSAGKLFDMEKEALFNLKNTSEEISEELLAFIAEEKPFLGKILGDEDLTNCIQKMTQEQQDYRMMTLEKSYDNIPQNRLDKPLSLFLQDNYDENIHNSIANLSPILKKVTKVSGIKEIFPVVAKTSRTNDLIRILELLSFELKEFLNETFEPFFSDIQYANSIEVLCQRANGFTLRSIAEKINLSHERIRQIEQKSTDKLVVMISDLPINIVSFICADTGNNDYISAPTICEYLEEFKFASQILYLLENENIYKDYQYNKQYDVFYRSELELDFSSLDIQQPIKELVLNDKEEEVRKKIEDFLIAKNLAKCTYSDLCNFTDSETGYTRVGKIIRLTDNIVEIEKDWYVHRSCIIDFNEAAEQILIILQNQFRQFHGYSNSHILYDAVCIDLAMFMNDNGFETESFIYMLVKHLFFKEKFKGYKFFFTEYLHIWERQTDFSQNSKGVLINLAKATDGIITRDDTEKYLENLKISKNVILNKIHDISDSTFYFYKDKTYVLSECLQIDKAFISNVNKSLDKLFDNGRFIIPRDINEDWFGTLPTLSLGLSWNLLLLQEIIKYNEEIGYKPLFSEIEQSPYRISGAFVKKDSVDTLVDIIYIYTYENFVLPYKDTTENYRKLLRKAGFIHDMEWFNNMHKVFDDPRFAFSNDNKNILIRK